MNTQLSTTNNSQPNYRVSVWEGLAIAAGAIGLVIVALIGLGIKAIRNAVDPQRVEAIAKSMMDYQIPGGSYGVVGINIGGLKVARVQNSPTNQGLTKAGQPSINTPPAVDLLIAEAPVGTQSSESNPEQSVPALSFEPDSEFKATTSHLENRPFCGMDVSVKIQEGILTSTTQQYSVSAIRYEARTVFNNSQHLVMLTTTGNNAAQEADMIFDSLRCKQYRRVKTPSRRPAIRY
ncbi:MAG TPA: hypothetical protein V6C91_17390 [Coleofasciculaceae cyanobacterium]